MSIEEKFLTRNNELQKEVLLEIEKARGGYSSKNIVQLQTILKELQESFIVPKKPLSYPEFIIDSWDYSDPLGIELVKLAELYKSI